MRWNLLLKCSGGFNRGTGGFPQLNYKFVLCMGILLTMVVCVKVKVIADCLWVQSLLKPFPRHLCCGHENLCIVPVRKLTYQKQLFGKFFRTAYISLHIDYTFCNKWNPWTQWSGTTRVATSVKTGWWWWHYCEQVGLLWRGDVTCVGTSELTIYESVALKILMSHLNMKGTVPRLMFLQECHKGSCTGQFSLWSPQWWGSSTSAFYGMVNAAATGGHSKPNLSTRWRPTTLL